VRVETSILSHCLFDERYIFQLSEIMVFNGDKNVALRGKVSVPTGRQPSGPWSHKTLVDGFTPYLMDSAQGESTPAVVSEIDPRHPAMLTIDLESVQTIDRIHLHSAQVGDTLPYMFDSRFGLPRRMRIGKGSEILTLFGGCVVRRSLFH